MTISIVIPSYNRPTHLRACLGALKGQSLLPDQVIMVVRPDDVSTTQVASECWGALAVQIVCVHERSIIAAETAGVAHARGEIIGFLDDDAVPAEDWCERIVAWYEDESVGAVGGPVLTPQADAQVAVVDDICCVRPWGEVVDGTHKLVAAPREVDHLRGCNMSVRKRFAIFDQALGGYCYRWELDVCLAARRASKRVVYDPAITVVHNQQGRVESAREVYCRQRNNTYVLLKHLPPYLRPGFLLFTLVWGDTGCPGIAQYLGWIAKHRRLALLTRALLPGMVGKVAGCLRFIAQEGRLPLPNSRRVPAV